MTEFSVKVTCDDKHTDRISYFLGSLSEFAWEEFGLEIETEILQVTI